MADYVIVGGGPSGALCGEQLARAGHSVDIFDEHLAWEKPCGGGLTYKATQCYPFLLDNPRPKKLIHNIEIISAENHRAQLDLDHPIVIYSRTVLNGLLLDRAREAGCRIHHSHVQHVDTDRRDVRLAFGRQSRDHGLDDHDLSRSFPGLRCGRDSGDGSVALPQDNSRSWA